MTKRLSFIFIILVSLFTLTQCKIIGKKLGSGVASGVKEENIDVYLEEMIGRIVANTRNELLGDTTLQKTDSLLKVVMYRLKTDANELTVSVRDSLLNEYTTLKIQQIIAGAGSELKTNVGNIRDELLGQKTNYLIAQIRNELLGDSTLLAIGAIRNELLGANTQSKIDSLIRNSIISLASGFEHDLKPQIQDTLQAGSKTVEDTVKYVAWALGILAIILALAIAYIFRKFSTRKKIMRILTQEINNIKNQEQYDELVRNIKSRTHQENVEKHFQEILKEENLYQQTEWSDKDQLLVKELTEALNKGYDANTLHKTLEEKELLAHFKSRNNI